MKYLTEPVPHKEAVKVIQDMPAVTRDVFDGLIPELRASALTVSGLNSAAALRRVREKLATVPAGENWDEAKAQLKKELEPWLGQKAERRAELLMRIHVHRAFTAQKTRELDEMADAFPYRMYVSADDSRVRPAHAALHGKVLPSNSPFWERHTPPWEWGCRCDVVGITAMDAAEMKADDAKKAPEKHRVMEGTAARAIEEGRLWDGNRMHDLRTPIEKGKPGGFEWSPKDVRPDIDSLRARYAAGGPEGVRTWHEFETWARNAQIPNDKRTVWNWMAGKPQSPKPGRTPATPVPARPADETAAAYLQAAGIDANCEKGSKEITEMEIRNLKALLSTRGTRTRGKVMERKNGVAFSSNSTLSAVEQKEKRDIAYRTVNSYMGYVPDTVALPKFSIEIHPDRAMKDALGDFSAATNTIRLREGLSEAQMKSTLFHEMTHWLHFNHPDSKKRDAIRQAFHGRVSGELPASVKSGTFDDDFAGPDHNAYSGRFYGARFLTKSGEIIEDTAANPAGIEFPTRGLQYLAGTDKDLAARCNEESQKTGRRAMREQLIQSLQLFF